MTAPSVVEPEEAREEALPLWVSLHGKLVSADSAALAITDRGFRFGDGLFESIAILEGRPYLWREHRQRLAAGLALLRIEADLTGVAVQLKTLIERNGLACAIARISISRGSAPTPGYGTLAGDRPTVLVTLERTMPGLARLPAVPAAVRLWLSRWRRPAPNASVNLAKTMQGMASVMARMEAAQQGCEEALQLSADGTLCCAASGNLLWHDSGRYYTPALRGGALAGTLRARMLARWPEPVAPALVRATPEALCSAQACVMLNSVRGAVPVSDVAPLGLQFTQSEALAARCNQVISRDIREPGGDWPP